MNKRTVSSRLNEKDRFNWTGGVKISLGREGEKVSRAESEGQRTGRTRKSKD
ncbi:MAG: hypothetical protein U9N83_10005 [Thermodesulfobacteriota bacterium]|nr:hypothetical protein [Thermodesulfobacteriota bacterium]